MTIRRKIKSEQEELEISGPGVERVRIEEVEDAARLYTVVRDNRIEMLENEVEAKKRLLEVMHENEGKIGKDRDGNMIYRFGDQVITVKKGKEEVKVKSVSGEEELTGEKGVG